MEKVVSKLTVKYYVTNITLDSAEFEVVTVSGNFLYSFSVFTIGSPYDPEPDYSGVFDPSEIDKEVIREVLPNYPINKL